MSAPPSLEPICASTEINSSAVSPPFPTIGKGHPQAAQKSRWTAIFASMPDKPVPVIRDTTAELYHQAGTGPVCLKAGHKPWRLDCLTGHVGFEPANPSASYLTGIPWQLCLKECKPGGGDPSRVSCVIQICSSGQHFSGHRGLRTASHEPSNVCMDLTGPRCTRCSFVASHVRSGLGYRSSGGAPE